MAGPSSGATSERFWQDRAGQASTVGTALLLVITIIGTGLIVTLGGSAIDGTQQSADINRAEHSMTMLDSRAAVVALDDAGTQSAEFGRPDSGSYRVEENTGRMTVVHRNYTNQGDNETIYDGSLGAVVYENGETTVAYQGGGVWRGTDDGSTLVSPPEFHFRGSTLTLPIIQITGSDSATGGSARIHSGGSRAIYPNSSSEYDQNTQPYANPIDNGTVTVTVEGQYYQGWEQYFRTRTDGNVSVDDGNQTVTLELEAVDLVGDFEFPPEDEPIRIRSMAEDHAVNDFQVTMGEGSNFNNMYFSFWMEDGGKEFEMLIHVPDNPRCNGGTIDGVSELVMDVYYHDESTAEGHHAWTNDSIPATEGPIRLQCTNNDPELYADFTSSQELAYGSFTTSNNVNNDQWNHDWEGTTASSVDFTNGTNHNDNPQDPSDAFGSGDPATLDLLVNHYFALFAPDAELRYNQGTGNSQGQGDPIDYTISDGTLEYDATGNTRFITYLHISENEIRVEFN